MPDYDFAKAKQEAEERLLGELMTAARKRAEAEEEAKVLIIKKSELESEIRALAKARMERAQDAGRRTDAFLTNFIMGAMEGDLDLAWRIVQAPSENFGAARLVVRLMDRWSIFAVRDGNALNPVFLLNKDLMRLSNPSGAVKSVPMADKLKAQLQLYMKAWTELPEQSLPYGVLDLPLVITREVKK